MAKKEGENLGVSGFTLGIVSILCLIFSPVFGVLISIVGFIFCLIQQRKNPTKLAKWGLILNVIGFAANMLWIFLLLKYFISIIDEQLQANIVG
ncbi:hypothetical protein HY448_01820 [Candidatus Pacearchaeota archaeon]|nr:hypothetical protein [Candidatus Pacearchaeota archaeon]